MLLKNNIIFSKKKIDLYKVFEIFWKQKSKITLFLFLFVTFFYFIGIIQTQKYITTVNISNNSFIENIITIPTAQRSVTSSTETLDKRYEFLKNIANSSLNDFYETNFFLLLELNFNKKNSYEEFLKIYHNFDKKLDLPKLIVKKIPKKIELQFVHTDNYNKELINKYIEYIFDLTILEHKLQIEKNIKMTLIHEIDVINACKNFEKTLIQSDACNLLKEQFNFIKKKFKALEKVNVYKDVDPDFVFYNIFYSSPVLISKKIELFIIFGFLMGLFVSGLLFFNLDTRKFK